VFLNRGAGNLKNRERRPFTETPHVHDHTNPRRRA